MTRALLSWALGAVIPHAGRTPDTAVVAIRATIEADVTFAATDRYTIGRASVPAGWNVGSDVRLPLSEATDLLRFIRPTRKAHEDEPVEALVVPTVHLDGSPHPGELHIGIADDSAVFELTDAGASVAQLEATLARLQAQPTDWGEALFQPSLLARFAKAQRDPADRLRLDPKRFRDNSGLAVVSVGQLRASDQPPSDTTFTGAIAGLEREAS